MLSIALMAGGSGHYYLDMAGGDYYLQGGEPPGRWWGKAAEELKLHGEIRAKDFHFILSGVSPDEQVLLRRPSPDPARARSGWDLTFSAPKSVSVLWSQADARTRAIIEQCQEDAVEAALGYLQDVAAFGRRGKGGEHIEPVRLVAALFPHGTSRAQDPQVHTHSLVMNVGLRPDGTWGSLETPAIFKHKMAAGALYRTELAHKLQASLGVNLELGETSFEVAGVPRKVLQFFSKRSAEIQKAMAEHGWSGARAAAFVTLDTREGKQHVPRAKLFPAWREEGTKLGFSKPRVERVLERGGKPTLPDRVDWQRLVKESADEVSKHNASFTEAKLLRQAVPMLEAMGMPLQTVLSHLRGALAKSPHLMNLGRVSARADAPTHYATRTTLEMEVELVDLVRAAKLHDQRIEFGVDRETHRVGEGKLAKALGRLPDLSEEQKKAVRHLTIETGPMACLVGMAGTGKTRYVLAPAVDAWKASGMKVIGTSVAAVVASRLRDELGIEARSVESLLWRLEKGIVKLTKKTVVVLDEAGMLGTRQFLELANHVLKKGAKLVCVGDPLQLPAIEAGRPFEKVSEVLGAAKLTRNERQREAWMRDAVKQFATGDARGALSAYAAHDRLHIAKTPAKAMERLIQDWARTYPLMFEPKETIILAATNSEVDALNGMAQAVRQKRGELGKAIKRRGGDTLHVGDRVLFGENRPDLGVMNGDFGIIESVKAINLFPDSELQARARKTGLKVAGMTLFPHSEMHPFQAVMTIRLDRENGILGARMPVRVTVPVDLENLRPGYATTVHKSQGTTVEQAFVLAGGWLQNREMSYVQMSRARADAHIYSTEDGNTGDDVNMLARSMERSRKKGFAMDDLKQSFALRDQQRRAVHSAPHEPTATREERREQPQDSSLQKAEKERQETLRKEAEAKAQEERRNVLRRHRGI